MAFGVCPFSTTEGNTSCHHIGIFSAHTLFIGQLLASGSQGCAEIEFLSLLALSVEVISSVTKILSCREDPSVRHCRSEQKLVELDISHLSF